MNKLRLFEITYNKLTSDKSFMAYYLEKLCLRDNKTKEDIMILLNCNAEDFYKLALCKAPETSTADFKQRIFKIAQYTNTPALILSNIIEPELSIHKQPAQKTTVLSKIKNDISQLFSLPQWLLHSKKIVYHATLSFCFIMSFIFIVNPSKQTIKTTQLYMTDHFDYTDAIKCIHLQDNTFVSINKL